MTPFTTLTSIAAPLIVDNVDTDTIIPSREMRSTGKTGLADGLFAPWRYSDVDARVPNPDFILNQPEFAQAGILLGGVNFGCGSSREHAVWALAEWGIRCVIAPSFAPIFRNNCIRNGVLPVTLDAATIAGLARRIVAVDLPAQTIDGHRFALEDEAKAMLVDGLDAIDLTLKHRSAIAAWQATDRIERPWIYLEPELSSLSRSDGEGDHPQDGGGVYRNRVDTSPPSLRDGPPRHSSNGEEKVKRLPPKSNSAVNRAKALRRSMTPPELRLWSVLKGRPAGLKFRKQHPAGQYTLDFYCPAAKLCIEVDGMAHMMGTNPMDDAARDAFLALHGVETLRIAAPQIKDRLEDVVTHIVDRARARLPLHHASHGPPPHSANGEEN